MVDKDEAAQASGPAWRWAYDFGGTLILWVYFTAGFILFFAPVYLAAWIFVRDTALAFQGLNRLFYGAAAEYRCHRAGPAQIP